MSHRPLSRGSVAILALGFLGVLLSSCRGEPLTGPLDEAQFAKVSGKGGKPAAGAGDIAISAVDPDTVTTDTILTVRVLGSGFPTEPQVSWALEGSETNAVRTIRPVLYVSSRELHATISVSRDAALARYDVVVTAAGGKKGIGVEKLEVVAKPILLPVPAWARRSGAKEVNDKGVIVGWAADAADIFHPLRWTPGQGGWVVEELAPGAVPASVNRSAKDITADGHVLVQTWERDPVTGAILWQKESVFTPGGQEVEVEGARYLSAINDNGTMVGTDSQGRPSVWRRLSASRWSDPIPLPSRSGYRVGMANEINNNEEIAGTIRRLDEPRMEWAAVWPYQNGQWSAPVPLDEVFGGCALAINDQGALAGCHWPCFDTSCTSLPSFWSQAGASTQLLPTYHDRLNTGYVEGINESNLVCGSAPIRLGKRGGVVPHAAVWRPGGGQARDLGAARGSNASTAYAINNGWPALAVGYSRNLGNASDQATVWLVF